MNSNQSYKNLSKIFIQQLDKKRVITEPSLCFALGTDASFYRMIPKIILKVASIKELISIIKTCRNNNTSYTFRAAGTSLSGQAVSDSVLIMLTDDWRQYDISDQGNKIKLQPGIIGADANRYLAKYRRKLGPDPASINSCKIGGIAANNASGMCCGTQHNSYQTLANMSIILADGCLLDTGDQKSITLFKKSHAELLSQLKNLAKQTSQDQKLKQLIKHKYRLKNTTGYGINALIDYQDPIDILQHLMIGSEGTLGFIADITFNTIADHPFKSTALIIYENIEIACQAVSKLSNVGIAAVELMDGRALNAIAEKPEVPQFIRQQDQHATGLLLECHADTQPALLKLIDDINHSISEFRPVNSIDFTSDQKTCQNLWSVRKGLFPAVGAIRRKGTSVIIEDIAFPVSSLALATRDLRALLDRHHYQQAIIFGHALEGNLHFVFTQDFNNTSEVERYKNFMQEVCELVAIKYQGSLKAEHGTGRNMAPFVELEWGKSGYALMQKIKHIFDPDNLMNPGVIINQNKNAHISHLKHLPIANEFIDQCIECGFCEVVCPSKNLTLSPRQRIVMYRQLQGLRAQKQTKIIKKSIKHLTKHFDYLGIDTCAATGLCAQRCPVDINTGEFIKNLRKQNLTQSRFKVAIRFASWTVDHFELVTNTVRWFIKLSRIMQDIFPAKLINFSGRIIHKYSSKNIPIWFTEYPTAKTTKLVTSVISQKKVVYIPSCTSRTLGTQTHSKDQRALSQVIISLLEKSGYQVIIPEEVQQTCCGLPYASKGMTDLAKQKQTQLQKILYQESLSGKLPVLMDTSPCAKYLKDETNQLIDIYEPAEFAIKYLLNNLTIRPISETIMLHITCSSQIMGLRENIIELAEQCASKVIVPDDIECCGFAGDKGFTNPELNESALVRLKEQVPDGCTRGYSNSITCEIGLSRHSGIAYQSILYLLDEVTD